MQPTFMLQVVTPCLLVVMLTAFICHTSKRALYTDTTSSVCQTMRVSSSLVAVVHPTELLYGLSSNSMALLFMKVVWVFMTSVLVQLQETA